MIDRVRVLAMLGLMASAVATAQGKPVKIVLVGDSTVALEGGWGPVSAR